jgi:hypothetical protein
MIFCADIASCCAKAKPDGARGKSPSMKYIDFNDAVPLPLPLR